MYFNDISELKNGRKIIFLKDDFSVVLYQTRTYIIDEVKCIQNKVTGKQLIVNQTIILCHEEGIEANFIFPSWIIEYCLKEGLCVIVSPLRESENVGSKT